MWATATLISNIANCCPIQFLLERTCMVTYLYHSDLLYLNPVANGMYTNGSISLEFSGVNRSGSNF